VVGNICDLIWQGPAARARTHPTMYFEVKKTFRFCIINFSVNFCFKSLHEFVIIILMPIDVDDNDDDRVIRV